MQQILHSFFIILDFDLNCIQSIPGIVISDFIDIDVLCVCVWAWLTRI